MWFINVKGMDVSQPLWLSMSGCPIKGCFQIFKAN